jgi:hypothetical protein
VPVAVVLELVEVEGTVTFEVRKPPEPPFVVLAIDTVEVEVVG